jgi:3-O-methylgallate 3,4-dioxygenase
MADIVLGVGTSHTPQISVPWAEWPTLGRTQEPSPHIPDDLDQQLQPEVFQRRHTAAQAAVKQLGSVLRSADLDAIVIFGDDQHEQFDDANMPAIAIYHGDNFSLKRREYGERTPGWMKVEAANWEVTQPEYPNHAELARHLIACLTEKEFEITRCSALRENVGIGHAFSFLYRRLWPECQVPIVPVMLNTYYPPNQPTPRRCYQLGQAIRSAVASWHGGQRVALMASGGLSHIVIDEPLDQQLLDALRARDTDALFSYPRSLLKGGTSEALNWIAVAGGTEHLQMTLVDYIPGYRTPPSTGCAMAFAYWN